MKKILIFILFTFLAINILSQTQGITYQAILISENAKEIPGIDVEGNYLPNQALTIRFSIIDENGVVNYQEEHQTQTDDYGMINVVIGEGSVTAQSQGAFSDIDWNGTSKDLNVEISLGASSSDFIQFSNENLHFVPYAYHRNITATGHMIIDGSTLLKDTLTVANGSPTFLSGNLAVDGQSTFNGLVIFQDILVENSTNLNGILNVNNGSPTNLSGSLDVTGTTNLNELKVNTVSALNGQVSINANVNGSQSSKSAYPLRVQGSNQGIAITVDGSRNTSKNFITFWDANGVQGRIEGQTKSELHNSFDYIWDQTYESLMTATQTALVIADLVGVDDADASIVEGVQMVAEIAHFTKRNVQRENTVGVVFASGGADYAEWLKKYRINEKFSFGDIVGVSGGQISKNMPKANSYMVISQNPAVLGNIPPKGTEYLYEKVAFMGQVLVKVRGKVDIGDYIIPSGLNDGFGIAVNTDKLRISDYSKIVGVAWSSASGNKLFSKVNVAIGLNTNAIANKLKQQEKQIQAMQNQLNSINEFLSSKYPDYTKTKNTAISNKLKQNKTNNINNHDNNINEQSKLQIVISQLESNQEVIKKIMANARKDLDERGINYKLFEQTNELVSNPNYMLNVIKSQILSKQNSKY